MIKTGFVLKSLPRLFELDNKILVHKSPKISCTCFGALDGQF